MISSRMQEILVGIVAGLVGLGVLSGLVLYSAGMALKELPAVLSGLLLFVLLLPVKGFEALIDLLVWIGSGPSVLWQLEGAPPQELGRAVVIAIAFIASFLTVIQIWRVPSRKSRFVSEDQEEEKASAAEEKDLSLYFVKNNVGRAVISGLGGMLVLSFLQDWWKAEGAGAKPYYIVWYVACFTLTLLFFAFLQSCNEFLRTRQLGYRLSTGFSVFFDTFFSYVQGKNQLKTGPFTEEILRLQKSMLSGTDEVCKQVFKSLKRSLVAKGVAAKDVDNFGVRVAVSVLDRDLARTWYVSKPNGSLGKPFEADSLAWLSIYLGRALWWKQSYDASGGTKAPDNEVAVSSEFVQFVKEKGFTFSGDKEHFSTKGGKNLVHPLAFVVDRDDQDYDAFVILPIPWHQRGQQSSDLRFGLHISFATEGWLDYLWQGLEMKPAEASSSEPTKVNYGLWEGLLSSRPAEPANAGDTKPISSPPAEPDQAGDTKPISSPPAESDQARAPKLACKDKEVCRALWDAITLLSTLLGSFNHQLYESTLRPQLESQR